MRKWLSISVLLLLAVLTGCGERARVSARLNALDSLVIDRPDSVSSVLASMQSQMEGEAEGLRMYYQLLCIKADFCIYEYPKNDSTVLAVLHYFEQHPDRYLTAQATYYAGRTYEYLGDALQAMDCYKQTLEMLPEDLDDQKSVFLRGCVFSHMGTLLYRQGLYEQALTCYQTVYKYDKLLHHKSMLVYDESDLGYTYYMLNQKDSALYYYDKAEQTAFSLGDTASLNRVRLMRVNYYRDEGNYQKALELNSQLLPCADPTNFESVYYLQGELFYRLNSIDSSRLYFQQVLTMPHASAISKGNANKVLGEISLREGHLTAAVAFLNAFIHYSDTISQMQKKEAVLKAYELYNYNLRERENQRLSLENERKTHLVVVLSLVLLLLFTIFVAFYYRNKRRKQLVSFERTRRKMLEDRSRLKLQQQEQINRKNLEKISLLKSQLERQSSIMEHFKAVDDTGSRMMHMTNDDWQSLEVALDDTYQQFVTRLRQQFPKMNEDGIRLCMLGKLGLTTRQISNIFSISPLSVTKRKQRLRKDYLSVIEEGKTFDEIIENM